MNSLQAPLLGIEIAGCGLFVPGEPVSNDELVRLNGLGVSDDWIRGRTGIDYRYTANPDLAEESTAAMAAQAGEQALMAAGLTPPYCVDSLIIATVTSDRVVQSAAAQTHEILGLEECGTHDVNAACAGFVYALDNAFSHIAAGRIDNALIIGAERTSSITDPHDKNTAVLFGDGAGAVFLRRSQDNLNSGSLSCYETTDSSQADILYCDTPETKIKMKGHETYAAGVDLLTKVSRRALEAAGLATDDVDLLIAHQANKRILMAATRPNRLNINQDRVAVTIDRYANTSSASVPMALADYLSRGMIKRGDILVLAAVGAGMTAAANVVRY